MSWKLELIVRRSLEDIEKRSQGLLGKGKTARFLDKTQDSSTVVKLIEELRQAILIYQVGTIGSLRSGRVNAFGIAIAAAINRQPSRTVDCKFPHVVFTIGTDGGSPSKVFFQRIYEAARGRGIYTYCETSADVWIEIAGGAGKDRIRPCSVGSTQGRAWEYHWR